MRSACPVGTDVVIVGAGLAGLTAAWRLKQQGVTRLSILEARPRVGGRTLTEAQPGGLPLDLGAQWIGPMQTRMVALAKTFGLPTFPSPDTGQHLMLLGGQRHTYRGLFPLRQSRIGLDVLRAGIQLEWASRRLDTHGHGITAMARALDQQTLGTWLDQRLKTPEARALFNILSGLTLGGDPDDLSLLWVLHHVRTAGGLLPLVAVKGGAQDRRFVQGAQQVSLTLASQLADHVQLNTPVTRIEWHGNGVRVHTDNGTIDARRVIVAMSPVDRQRLAFDPPLPEPVSQLQQRMTLFKGMKVQVVYPRPFWRDAGLSGQVLCDRGLAPLSFDNSHPDHPQGVLVTFVSAKTGDNPLLPSAEQLADPALRRQGVLDCLATYFGPQAATPLAYVEKDWRDDPWSSGCIPAMAPGVMSDTGETAQHDVGPLIWAGTEMADRWGGYMEGAVRSGERAASAVLQTQSR